MFQGPVCAIAPSTHGKSFFPIDPEELLVVHLKALSVQQDTKAAIAKPAAFVRKFPQSLPQKPVTLILFPVLER